MNMGWRCPNCGGCYSPSTPQCYNCTGRYSSSSSVSDTILDAVRYLSHPSPGPKGPEVPSNPKDTTDAI